MAERGQKAKREISLSIKKEENYESEIKDETDPD